jgi:sulfur carrier protein ThiS
VQVSVKLIGHLLDYLPNDGADFAGSAYTTAAGTTVAALARAVGLPEDAEYFVMLNGDHVTANLWTSQTLGDGDQIVFCPPLKGG